MNSESPEIAEVHYYFAECLENRGDFSAALRHALICKKLRENYFGPDDSKSVDAFRQTARLLLKPYQNYQGVITPQIRGIYTDAIMCLEKVFRYLKAVKKSKSIRKEITMKRAESSYQLAQGREEFCHFDSNLTVNVDIAGPLIRSPFGTKPSIPKSLLHDTTKKIVSLKLSCVESPQHREFIRNIRQQLSEQGQELNSGLDTIDTREIKAVILRMAAVSPSIYLDGLFQRIDDNEYHALEELRIAILITEENTIGVTI